MAALQEGNNHSASLRLALNPKNHALQPVQLRFLGLSHRSRESNMIIILWSFPTVVIESVELVSVPNAPVWQEKVYRAHLDSGEGLDEEFK